MLSEGSSSLEAPGKQGLTWLSKDSHWLGRRLDWSAPTMPINSKTPQLLPPAREWGKGGTPWCFPQLPLPLSWLQ